MKQIIFVLIFVSLFSKGKAQCIFIYASEKIKGVEIPIERREFDVVISDSIKKHVTSFNDGDLGRMSLPVGKYNVKISNPEFTDGFAYDVIVRESRTTDVVINLTRVAATKPPVKEEKKEEKKEPDK